MLKIIQKYVPVISILLLVILLATLLFYPDRAQGLSTIILIFGIGTAVVFAIQGNWETKQNDEPFGSAQDRLSNAQFARNTAIDLLGLVLIMLSAMWLGRMAGSYAGETWGIIAGIISGIAVGFGAALVAGKVWGRAADRFRVTNA